MKYVIRYKDEESFVVRERGKWIYFIRLEEEEKNYIEGNFLQRRAKRFEFREGIRILLKIKKLYKKLTNIELYDIIEEKVEEIIEVKQSRFSIMDI